jgi:hypothetical protein
MSVVSLVYAAEVIGGVLRPSVEGRPCWLEEVELRSRLTAHSRGFRTVAYNDELCYTRVNKDRCSSKE